ncbi:nuclear transport factor 2 family protein [Zobellia galactanivorans]|uniref:nuclear transport factor 2 family protein n=1 Tax=Zobellia galactanivorans (strain DSM 12802 / CCUG 47099 / CIP 106680 / NCIMB 13871 / Dsij) TaxID=63186 RepID=UPI0020917BA2|nr:nuclear transport factor 2 family protein [Zobellia galactanivorans]MDO6808956.1 nuclear transport factor 2 family protein [Zobellia galactanivorans]
MKSTFLTAIFISALSLSSCNGQDDDVATPKVSNKEKVIEVLKSIETGAQEPASYINPESYTQHNLGVADGLAGFGEILQALPSNSAKVNTIRAFEDGDYIFTHTDYNFFGPKIGFDVFRFENGLIVEHWDNLQVTPEQPNPSGHTMIDGAIEITDLDKTEANKTLVRNFITDILINGNMDKIGNYFEGDQYIQHNPNIADGLSGLGSALAAMAEQGVTMEFSVIHKVLGQGNFVLSISEGHFGGAHTSYYDLFRVENGKIAEHWDVIETIAPEADRKNTNGKFNFPN